MSCFYTFFFVLLFVPHYFWEVMFCLDLPAYGLVSP